MDATDYLAHVATSEDVCPAVRASASRMVGQIEGLKVARPFSLALGTVFAAESALRDYDETCLRRAVGEQHWS